MFLDDLIILLQTNGVATLNVNMFVTSKSVIPDGSGPYLSLTETGGSGSEGTHNARFVGKAGYTRPTAQLVVRAASYPAARQMAQNAYDVILRVGSKSQLVNNVWWRSVGPLQEPFDMGLDNKSRAQVVFNIAAIKRPDAASSL